MAGPGAVAGGVELLGGLGVGVVVEELVEQSDRVGIGLALLPCSAWQGKADGGVLPAAESDVEVDLIGLVDRDVVISSRTIRLRSRAGVAGSVHRAGKSAASWRICALRCSLSAVLAAVVWRSYSSWASWSARRVSFQSASRVSATSRLSGSTAR